MTRRTGAHGAERRASRGTTLVELTITIAVLGIIASVAGLTIRRQPAPVDDLPSAVMRARRTAAEKGLPVRVSRMDHAHLVEFVAYPDGRVVADSAVGVERLTGQIIPVAP